MKKLFIVSGSVRSREDSHTYTFASNLRNVAEAVGFGVDLLHIGDEERSPALVKYHSDPFAEDVPEDIRNFARLVRDADVVLLVSPTYHGSYTSQMKNLLDCLTEDAFRGKTIIIASHGWGPSAIQPALHLQDVSRTMMGNIYPRFITASTGDLSEGTVDAKTKKRIVEILQDVFSS
jgi:NAD(P)H-dependent FMN reductase